MCAESLKRDVLMTLTLFLFIGLTNTKTAFAQSVFKIPSFTGKTLSNKTVDRKRIN